MLFIFAFIGIIHVAFGRGCDQPIGVSTQTKGVVVTCSSTRSPVYSCQKIGLNNRYGSWCSSENDVFHYVEVLLPRRYHVTKISTQGNEASGDHVTSYFLAFPDPLNVNRIQYILNSKRRPKVFTANSDGKTVVSNSISIMTNKLFLIPQKSVPSSRACLRLELYGCAGY